MAKQEHTSMLVAWLNDAYAMEQSQEKMLESFIKDFEEFPEIKQRLETHLEETKRQADDVQTCIEHLGGKVSKVKSIMGNISGMMQGVQTTPFKDRPVKDMLMLHAGEHFEHICYMALAEGARELGKEEIAEVCERIAEEEKETAGWAEKQLPTVVRAALMHEPAAA